VTLFFCWLYGIRKLKMIAFYSSADSIDSYKLACFKLEQQTIYVYQLTYLQTTLFHFVWENDALNPLLVNIPCEKTSFNDRELSLFIVHRLFQKPIYHLLANRSVTINHSQQSRTRLSACQCMQIRVS
jgi:hypothetical protein